MKLAPNETELVGAWIMEGGKVRGDPTCERIEWLVAHHLKEIAISKQWGAWETLYQDPDDSRYWERTYPQSELQGGGPPRLAVIAAEEVKRKYGFVASSRS
jgi:hypothetical protein